MANVRHLFHPHQPKQKYKATLAQLIGFLRLLFWHISMVEVLQICATLQLLVIVPKIIIVLLDYIIYTFMPTTVDSVGKVFTLCVAPSKFESCC